MMESWRVQSWHGSLCSWVSLLLAEANAGMQVGIYEGVSTIRAQGAWT